MTDPISDLLTRIRNAGAVKQEFTDIPYSKVKLKIIEILLAEGFISDFKKLKKQDKKFMRVFLKYEKGEFKITGIKRVSTPGQRIYKKYKELKTIRGGFGFSIVSTSKGIILGSEARKQKLGGEVIAEIW